MVSIAEMTSRQALTAAALGASGVLVLAGCGPMLTAGAENRTTSDAVVSITPDNPANPKKTPVNEPIVVSAANGQLTTVTVTGPDGPVAGAMNPERTRWQSDSPDLDFNSRYRVTATAVDEGGLATTVNDSFKTVEPKATQEVESVSVEDGQTYGVGMPVTLVFPEPVKTQQVVAENLKLYANREFVGAWKWNDDGTAVTFRPKDYYPAKTKIRLDANLKGVPLGNGVYGAENIQRDFKIGSAVKSVVNAEKHRMKVYKNGVEINDIPITTGMAGYETRSGIKVIIAKEGTTTMTAPGKDPGDPEYYQLQVDNAMRVTWSGEYLHAAPWSVGSQGYANVSHGCVGMSDSYAGWMYGLSKVGDIVVVKGTNTKQDLGNGYTDWNIPWETWLADSATGEVKVGPAPGMTLAPPLPAPVAPSASASPSAQPQA